MNKYLIKAFMARYNEEVPEKTLKSYAFDWDDNIQFLPTKIKLRNKDGDYIDGFSTEHFAHERNNPEIKQKIANEGYSWDFEDFRNDFQFLKDEQQAKPGPSWKDFVECINNGFLFAIITARGHSPEVYKQVIIKMITKNQDGINKNKVVESVKSFREASGQSNKLSDEQLINKYVNQGKYYPVSNPIVQSQLGGSGDASSPEQLKVKALLNFKQYISKMHSILIDKIGNRESLIGFSDDDKKNFVAMKTNLGDEKNIKLKYTGK